MEHKLVICPKCKKVIGCNSLDSTYFCNVCAWRIQCFLHKLNYTRIEHSEECKDCCTNASKLIENIINGSVAE